MSKNKDETWNVFSSDLLDDAILGRSLRSDNNMVELGEGWLSTKERYC